MTRHPLGRGREDSSMIADMLDELPHTNDVEGWQCPDCQSGGPFTVDVIRRVMLSEEGTPFLEDDGAMDYDDQAFGMCHDCQRQAPVASFRHEGA